MLGVALAWISWMLSLVSSTSYTRDTLPNINNENFIKNCVHVHNKFRSEVYPPATDMLYMTWDPELAKIAQRWARNCRFEHNTQLSGNLHPNFSSLGENIWTGSLPLFNVSQAITAWYNEIEYYDFDTRACSHVCGHYTQVIWADSFKVGCAVQFCTQIANIPHFKDSAHFICNYGPAGNYPTSPYKKGRTCSACQPNDNCLDNLCINQKRDQVTGYYSIKFPDWPIYLRNRNLSTFLIISSLIIVPSIVITFWFKHKCLNVAPTS